MGTLLLDLISDPSKEIFVLGPACGVADQRIDASAFPDKKPMVTQLSAKEGHSFHLLHCVNESLRQKQGLR